MTSGKIGTRIQQMRLAARSRTPQADLNFTFTQNQGFQVG